MIAVLSTSVAVVSIAAAGWSIRRLRREAVAHDDVRLQLAGAIDDAATLTRERDRLIDAFDALHDGVVVVDDQGDELVRNVAARGFSETRRAEVLAEEASQQLLGAALRGIRSDQEISLVGPPARVLELRAAPLSERGRVVGAVVGIRDLTEQRRVDDVRRDFVANVSHELRTPIGALAVLAETMADETELAVMRRLAGRISREAERLARIVDDLLDLSQLEAGSPAERAFVDVRSVVRAAVDQVSGAAEATGIEVRVGEIDPGLELWADRRQLVSAVFNLLDNAVKYSEPGSAVDVDVEIGARSVAIMVRDQGVGIPTRDLERIFERFYRVDRARSRGTGGTGLGLSIVRHVAQIHGGEVSAVSHEGEGSVFTLTVPFGDAGTPSDSREGEGES